MPQRVGNGFHDERKECVHQREERPEIKLREEQRTFRIKGKYVV